MTEVNTATTPTLIETNGAVLTGTAQLVDADGKIVGEAAIAVQPEADLQDGPAK